MKRLLVGPLMLASVLALLVIGGAPAGTAPPDTVAAPAAPTLSSVTVASRVTGGDTVVVTVRLSGGATAATRVRLTSSSRAVLPTRGSVTVPAGESTISVTVRSAPVPRSTTVTVGATLGATTRDDRVTVLPPAVAAVSLPAAVGGGLTAAGTVTLTGPAPEGGILVALRASRPSRLSLPASVRVAARRTTADLVVAAVDGPDVTVTVTARLGGSRSDAIGITAPQVSLDLPPRLFADVPVTGRVVLNGIVPSGGPAVAVALTMSVPTTGAMPTSVRVEPGASSAALGFTPVAGHRGERIGLTARLTGRTGAGSSVFRHLRIESNIRSVVIRPAARGAITTGTIRLHQPYPARAIVVLTLGDPTVATLPGRVGIPAGRLSAGFDVQLDANGSSDLTATHGSSTTSTPDALVVGIRGDLETSASLVYAGVTTAVRLRIERLPYPVTLRLRSSDPSLVAFDATTLMLPADAAGELVELPIQVKGLGPVTLSASYDGVTISGVVTPRHVVRSIDLLDPLAVGTVRVRLTLNLARGRDYMVMLHSTNEATFDVPVSVTVPAGESSVSFPMQVMRTQNTGPEDLVASYGGVTMSLTIARAFPSVASVEVPPVYAGVTTMARVTLDGPTHPTSPMVVELRSTRTRVATVAASVTIAAGSTSVEFPVTGVGVGSTELTVRANGSARSTEVVVVGILASLAVPSVSLGLPASGMITLVAPAPQDIEVALTIDDATVAGIPATVVVPAGSRSAPVAITGLAVGGATLTAQVAGLAVDAELTVDPLFGGIEAGSTHYVDVGETVTVRLARPAPYAIEVTLTSSDPGVATVTSSVRVPAGRRGMPVPVANVAAGTTELTASFAGQTTALGWVVAEPRLASVSAPAAYVGLTTTGTVTLAGPAEVDTVVALRAGHPDLLLVPASVTVAAGDASAGFPVEGLGAGGTEIRASVVAAYDRAAPVTVVEIVADLSLPDAIAGEVAMGTVTLAAPAPHAFEVRLGSADPAIATVPATLTIPAGQASVEFPIAALGSGTTTVALTFGALELERELTVAGATMLTTLTIPQAYAGIPASGLVELAAPAAGDTELRLSSSDPAVGDVPPSITIPAGETGGRFAIATPGEGDATITVGLGSEEIGQPLSVVALIEGLEHGTLYPRRDGVVRVLLRTTLPAPVDLAVAFGSPAITGPSSVAVSAHASFVDIQITAHASGDVALTLTLSGHPFTGTVRVSPLLSGIACAACPAVENQVGSATLTVHVAPTDVMGGILLVSDNLLVATVPGAVAVNPGATAAVIPITALAAGHATITATWEGETVSLSLDIGANALAVSRPPDAVPVGSVDESAWVSLASAPTGGEVVITVTVGDAAVAGAPSTVTIGAGSTGVAIPLTGLGAGTTTVTVAANGQTRAFDVVVTEVVIVGG